MTNLLGSAALVVMASALKAVGTLLVGVLLARHLGPNDLGKFQLLITIVTMWATFGCLGIGRSTLYYVNKKIHNNELIVSHGIAIGILLAIMSSAGFAIMTHAGGQFFGNFSRNTLIICSISVSMILLQSILRPILLSQNKIKLFSFVISLVPYLQIVAIANLLYFDRFSISTVLLVSMLTQGIVLLVSLFGIFKILRFTLDLVWKRTIEIIIHGLKLHLSNILLFLDKKIAILLIPLIIPGEFSTIGYFSRAVAICGIFQILLGAVFDVLYSNWSQMAPHSRLKQAQRTSRILLAFGLVTALLIFCFSEIIIVSLYGKQYILAVDILKILIFQQLLWSVSKIFQSFYAAEGKPTKTNIGLLVMLTIEAPLIYLFSKYFGLKGLAMALLVSQLVFILCNIYMQDKKFTRNIKNWLIFEKDDFSLFIKKVINRQGMN